jgi:hypothetical protein
MEERKIMRIDIIRKMDRAILELALIDAFCDMCFYEGDEFIQSIEKYVSDIDTEKNTEEQDIAFFEVAAPYINNSVMIYCGESLTEAQEEKVVGADTFAKSNTPADVLNQTGKTARDEAKDKLAGKAVKKLTEEEEAILSDIIFETLKASLVIAKDKIFKVGKNLADATTVGLSAARKKFIENKNAAEKETALAAPDDKK